MISKWERVRPIIANLHAGYEDIAFLRAKSK
jgi:hypothetical protein